MKSKNDHKKHPLRGAYSQRMFLLLSVGGRAYLSNIRQRIETSLFLFIPTNEN